MLDFHYSDTWADPGKQFTPASWAEAVDGKSREEQIRILADSVYRHTATALEVLKREGATPDFIQVGNEITFGTLWPTGKTDPYNDTNWDALLTFLRAGVKACREACPKAQIIIHTEHAQEWNTTERYYARLAAGKIDYDVIGLSYYPMWHGTVRHLGTVLDSIKTVFNKPVMIVETAFYYSHKNDKWVQDPNQNGDIYPISAEGQRRFTEELCNDAPSPRQRHRPVLVVPRGERVGQAGHQELDQPRPLRQRDGQSPACNGRVEEV